MITVYGLFNGEHCIYVGRTKHLERRILAHQFWVRLLPYRVTHRILASVPSSLAADTEREFIRRFRVAGQADYNRQHCYTAEGSPEPQKIVKPVVERPKSFKDNGRITFRSAVLKKALMMWCQDTNSTVTRGVLLALDQYIPREYFEDAKKETA